jgi:hypothetical protein
MGFVDQPHVCPLPFICHGSAGKMGAYFECDHCKRTWRVVGRQSTVTHESLYYLTFTSRIGDYVEMRSHLDMNP